MALIYQDVRERMEADGYKVSDDEFSQILSYARRKAEVSGKGESYLPLLLPDVIREWLIRQTVNRYSIAMMEILRN